VLVLGARAVLAAARNRTDGLSRWALALQERRGYWKAVVASAAKNARMAWAMLALANASRCLRSFTASGPLDNSNLSTAWTQRALMSKGLDLRGVCLLSSSPKQREHLERCEPTGRIELPRFCVRDALACVRHGLYLQDLTPCFHKPLLWVLEQRLAVPAIARLGTNGHAVNLPRIGEVSGSLFLVQLFTPALRICTTYAASTMKSNTAWHRWKSL
jgi:hypothetical protein